MKKNLLRAPLCASMRVRRAALLAGVALSLPLAAHAAGAEAYVSDQLGGVTVLDVDTLTVKRRIDPQSKSPRGIGVTADGKLLVTANRDEGDISIIDRASGDLLRHVKVGQNPEFVRIRGRLAFVSYEPSSDGKPPPPTASATASASASGAEPAGGPPHERDDDDDKEPAHIAVVDLVTGKVLRSILGGIETEGIEFSTDRKHILITNEAANTVTVHRIDNGKRVRTIDVSSAGTRPRGIKRAPDGKSYVATIEHGNAFVVIGADYKLRKSVATAEYPYGIAFDPTGERIFVAAARSKVLQVFDAKTYALIKSVPTGERCWHFSFTPDVKQILLACGRSNEVVAIDATSLEVVKRIPDLKQPWGVVTYPKSAGSVDEVE